MNLLQLGNSTYKLPSKVDELSNWQLKRIAPLLLGRDLKQLRTLAKKEKEKRKKSKNPAMVMLVNAEFYHIRLQMLFILLDLRWKFGLQFWLWRNMSPDLYAQVLNHEDKVVDWLFSAELTEQRFPAVWIMGKKFLGPRKEFRNLTYLEYTFAHSRYVAWLEEPTRENLQLFFGVLYRAERKDVPRGHRLHNADAREEFDSVKTDEHAKTFKHLDERVMLCAVLWWQGCSGLKRRRYKHVYSGGAVDDPLTPKQVIIKLAGSAKANDIEAICNSLYDNVMEDLDMHNKEAQERKMNEQQKKRA
jgi:hypothetical protein